MEKLHGRSGGLRSVPLLTRPALPRSLAIILACSILSMTHLRAGPAEPAGEGEWTMPGKNCALTRLSGLDQITVENVKDLKVAWTFSTGVNRGHEAAPIVVGTMIYVVIPYPSILYGLDLKVPGTFRWKYEPKPAAAAQGIACCDYVNRGAVFSDGKVFINTFGWSHRRGGCRSEQGALEDPSRRYPLGRDSHHGPAYAREPDAMGPESPAVDPRTAMPNLHVSEVDARDIAGFLYTSR